MIAPTSVPNSINHLLFTIITNQCSNKIRGSIKSSRLRSLMMSCRGKLNLFYKECSSNRSNSNELPAFQTCKFLTSKPGQPYLPKNSANHQITIKIMITNYKPRYLPTTSTSKQTLMAVGPVANPCKIHRTITKSVISYSDYLLIF